MSLFKSLILISLFFCLICCNRNNWINGSANNKNYFEFSENKSISKFEVSNKEFRYFLNDIKSENQNDYDKYYPDSLRWTDTDLYNQPYSRNYFWHAAFNDFPVVNITEEAANAYCDWLSLNHKKRKVVFRLPTKEEFLQVYKQLDIEILTDEVNDYQPRIPFNLKYYAIDSDGIKGIMYHVDGAMFTSATRLKNLYRGISKSKFKNYKHKSGVYHLIGNVEEMLIDGTTIGGSFDSLPSEVLNSNEKPISPNPRIGFRVVKEIVN